MQSRVCNWNIWFSTETNRNLDQFLCILCKINACVHRMTYTNFHIRSQKPQKNTYKCNIDSIWPVCQLWSFILDCVRDSDLKRYFYKHKSLKIALKTRNEDKRTSHWFRQLFASRYRVSCRCCRWYCVLLILVWTKSLTKLSNKM